MEQHGVVGLIADRTRESPEIDKLMRELGNTGLAIPFYAIFPGDGRPPITFEDVPLRQKVLLERLREAVSTSSPATGSTASGAYR